MCHACFPSSLVVKMGDCSDFIERFVVLATLRQYRYDTTEIVADGIVDGVPFSQRAEKTLPEYRLRNARELRFHVLGGLLVERERLLTMRGVTYAASRREIEASLGLVGSD